MSDRREQIQQVTTWSLVAVAALALVLFLVPSVREGILGWFHAHEQPEPPAKTESPLVLLKDGRGGFGLRISRTAMNSYQVDPAEVVRAEKSRPMPPQIGTVNFDNDYLYSIRPRFAGEIVSFMQIKEPLYPGGPPRERDISFGDKVKQGDVLAVFWSKDLGLAKAALVDAIVSKSLSEQNYRRYQELATQGAISDATLRAADKQLRSDINAYNSALRPLYVWKLPATEIDEVKQEAATILKDITKPRDPEEEIKRWARVEVRAPVFALDENGKPDPNREMIILEKNTTANDFVDPGRDTPLFKLADVTRLQIWIHPPEEFLPMLRAHLNRKPANGERNGRELRLLARFQADPPGTPPLALRIARIAPSLDPTLKTPMLVAELKNADRNYLVGQFVNALIELPALPDTVEVPTDAVNLVESQSLVLVRPKDGKDNEYFLRRVSVAQTAGKMTLIRSKLTPEDEKLSADEVARNRRPIEALQPGEYVLTRGVVELTAALEELVTNPPKKE
jgi:membrane fusion protein, heavy metal efflux system